jgi:hypothetical protein
VHNVGADTYRRSHLEHQEQRMTSTPLSDTWASRDLPVLREYARLLDEDVFMPGPSEVAPRLDVNEDVVLRAYKNLERGGYVIPIPDSARRSGDEGCISDITGDALRVIGTWPTPESALDRMIDALEEIAENTNADEDTRTRARRILEGLAGAGRTIGVTVAAAAITGQIPGQ